MASVGERICTLTFPMALIVQSPVHLCVLVAETDVALRKLSLSRCRKALSSVAQDMATIPHGGGPSLADSRKLKSGRILQNLTLAT